MNDQTDAQLLRAYAEHRSDPAFAELVRRHVDMVHSAAVRMVCDSHLAQDVTQGVFLALARSAAQLTDRPVLSGWLHRTAQNIAAQTVRTDVRRRVREQEAAAMNELLSAEPDALWEQIAPHLDTALGELSEADRDAVLLRYFERKSASEMATRLGISDEAAQKRVNRAVERLREFFAKHGLTVGASGLVVVISANAVQAAPAGLAITISTAAALAGTSIATTATATAIKTIAMTTFQKTLVATAIAILTGAGIYEARQASTLRSQNQSLSNQYATLKEQLQYVSRSLTDASNDLAAIRDENERLKSGVTLAELLRLRGQVAQLRSANAALGTIGSDPIQTAAKSWLDRVNHLKKRLEQTPGATIPEFKLLNDDNWLNAASGKLESEEDYRRAFAQLRRAGENIFIVSMQVALQKYIKENSGQFPAELSQLIPHFEGAPEDTMLQRYAIVPASSIPSLGMGGDWLITVRTPVDEEFDTVWGLGPNGFGTTSHQNLNEAAILAAPLKAFQSANNGQQPQKPLDLLPYATTPEQLEALRKLEQKSNSTSN